MELKDRNIGIEKVEVNGEERFVVRQYDPTKADVRSHMLSSTNPLSEDELRAHLEPLGITSKIFELTLKDVRDRYRSNTELPPKTE